MAAGQEEKWAELLWAALREVTALREPGGDLELAEPGDELGREVAERLREWLQSAGRLTENAELAEAGWGERLPAGEVQEGELAAYEVPGAAEAFDVAKTPDGAGEAGAAVLTGLAAEAAAEDVRLRRNGAAAAEVWGRVAKPRAAEMSGAAGESYAGRSEGNAAGYEAGSVFAARWQAGLAADVQAGGQEVARRDGSLSEAEIERICGVVLERLCAGIDVYLQSSAV